MTDAATTADAPRFAVEPCTFLEAATRSLCVWPLSGSGEEMVVCGDERTPGKSYCAKHVRTSSGGAA
jgi:hypothetical protein